MKEIDLIIQKIKKQQQRELNKSQQQTSLMTRVTLQTNRNHINLLVVNPSLSGSDWPLSYKAKTATEYSIREVKSLRS